MRRLRRRTSAALRGTITVPGDKSISHRALILATLARGMSRVEGLNRGADVGATIAALEALGAAVRRGDGTSEVEVEGCGWDGLREPAGVIDAGNSGTTLRLLAALCAATEGLTVLTGDDTLRQRPMLRVVAPLRQMGASIDGRRYGDRAPLVVRGGRLRGIDFTSPVASAQVKSALLLAGLAASGRTSITEPRLSRDHTERMLEAAGVAVERAGTTVAVDGGSPLQPLDQTIPGDISSALFLIVAAALLEGSDLRVGRVGLNPTRTGALEVLAQMGARLQIEEHGRHCGEPVGEVRVAASELAGVVVGEDRIATLIDEVPILAVAATQAHGETVITGAGELRVKESDRIATIAQGLASLGADIEPLPDGLIVRGPTPLHGGEVDARGDHRLALAFAVAGLLTESKVRVIGWHAVTTSFPEFVDVLAHAQRGGS